MEVIGGMVMCVSIDWLFKCGNIVDGVLDSVVLVVGRLLCGVYGMVLVIINKEFVVCYWCVR